MGAVGDRPWRRRRFKRAGFVLVTILGLALGAATGFSYYLAGARRSGAPIGRTSPSTGIAVTAPARALKVMTLNLAHGRKDGTHQFLQSTARIRSQLDDVVAVLERVQPDVVALQEADGPSFWSGNFDHVEYVAQAAGFGYFTRAEHVKGLGLSYGTGIVSRRRVDEAKFVTFEPTPPSPSKGYLLTTVEWRVPDPTVLVDVVSVHLDFSRSSVRDRQVATIARNLKPRRRPLIVMGDFNCSWSDDASPLRVLAADLELRAYQPEASNLATFPSTGRRLDWILISKELEFQSCRVLPDILSDHLAVVAAVSLAK